MCIRDRSKANVSLVIETMYAVAADPERWEEVIEALDVPAQDGEAPLRLSLIHI